MSAIVEKQWIGHARNEEGWGLYSISLESSIRGLIANIFDFQIRLVIL